MSRAEQRTERAASRIGRAAEVRAMILAAGLGTRLRPLTSLRAKPALPIRGRPVISLLLALLARHGVRDVMINLHHLPESIRDAVSRDHPTSCHVHWSEEPAPLGTGGGIRRAAEFLRGAETCLVLAGDMLLDLDLDDLVARHRTSGRDATLILRDDPRGAAFGTVGVDAAGRVTRIGRTPLEGAARETTAALFTGVRIFSRRMLGEWPDAEIFEDLRDWILPASRTRRARLGAEIVPAGSSVWEPVGTMTEYLATNLEPPVLPSLGGAAVHWQRDVEIQGSRADVIVSTRSKVDAEARLERVVVWEDELVPAGFHGRQGIYAGGRFHPCPPPESESAN